MSDIKGKGSKSGGHQGCRVAFASDGDSVDRPLARLLASASFFIIAEGSPDHLRVIRNAGKGAGSAAGIKGARQLADEGVTEVVTGNIGPKASEILEGGRIIVHAGCSGTVSQAMTRCLAGKLAATTGASYSGCLESPGTAKAVQ